MQRLAPTMNYDFAGMGYPDRGAAIPVEDVRSIAIPTLVITGADSPAFLGDTASRIESLLPDGELTVLPGADHAAPAEVMAPVVAAFLSR